MKQENTKKSKKWLWLLIGLVALIAVAGVVLALVLGGGSDDDVGPVGGRPDLYWNIDKAVYTENSESGLSTREPGEDGVYRVRFAYNGEQVELPVVDKQLVNFIDTMDAMGIVQDADGVVVDVVAAEDFMTPVALNAYVQQVMDGKIIANSSIAMNGMQYQIELCELTEIYNVSDTAQVAGEIIDASEFLPMDSIWVYANDLEENTHIYMTDHPEESAVYWRAYQMWNSAEKTTSRVPDENGVYSIDFCCNGQIVTLKCKDKSIVSSIDNKSPHSCHFGFLFDEEGYITQIMNSGIGIRGAVAAERIEITELDGSYFSGAQLIPSDGGHTYSATLPEDCPIYDASSSAEREGRLGESVDSLKLGDRICVWTDSTGTPVLVYIANRLVDVPAYYNLTRKYDSTLKETTREPNWEGYYEFEMVETGKVGKVTVKTKDKELATFIDAIANRVVGLKLEGNIIKYAYTSDDVFGWTPVYGGYVPQIQGSIVSLVSFSKPDSPTNILLSANVKVYDVSGKDVPYGTETTLRVGDIATVARDVSCNGVVVYVTRRLVGGDCVYYNLDYQYNSTKKETNRVPDENGWYYFTMAHNGKQVTVKTKNKEFADLIDKSPYGDLIVVMRVENGIVQEVYDTQAAYGQILRSGYRVSAVNGDGTYTVMSSSGKEFTLKMADDCVIYNVSTVYDDFRGERIYSLKVGDMVSSLCDYRSEAKLIYVRQRTVDKMYVNRQQMYDSSNKVTLREPDAEGWYWFELAVDGQLKWFKTKDKDLATSIDAYATPFGLRVDGDEILNVVGPKFVGSVSSVSANAWDVTSLSKWSMDLQYNKPGSNYGKTLSLNLASNMKVYDISPTAEQFGAPVTLKKGDTVLTYSDIDKNVVYCYVLFHETRAEGVVAYCEHCDQTVRWTPWAGAGLSAISWHYYLPGDVSLTKQTTIGNTSKDYEIVFDLNGSKLTVNGARAFLAYRGDTITVIDSVGGGEVAATGIDGGNGGTVLVSADGTFNLYSGTLSFIDSDAHVFKGATMAVSGGTFNMYGGALKGGISNSPDQNVFGGNLYLYSKATFNMYGGVIEEGRAERTEGLEPAVAAQGGNIYAVKNSVINLAGGEIRNGYSNQHGGNIFLATSTLNMSGGKITGGEALYSGGNLYNQFGGVINMTDGVVEKGTAGAMGNNLYASHDTGVLNFAGGTVTGDISVGNAASVTVSGAPKITVGGSCGLSLPTTVKLTLGELAKGAEIYVNAKGVFSEQNKNAQAYLNAGYIKAAAPRTSVVVKDNALAMQGEVSYCEHCLQDVEWVEWPGTNSPVSGHYFLAKDTVQKSQISIVADTDVVLDLYGKTYSSEKIRNFLVRGTLSIMDSVGGGVMESTGGEEFAGSIALVSTVEGSERPAGFNLYSGTLKLADDHPTFANGGLISFNGGELNMYGGKMIGGNVAKRGGCVTVSGASSVMNIFGGEITGGTADIAGGCLYIAGTVNIAGGTVDGQVYVDKGASVVVAGAPEIGEMSLYSGIKADVSGLTEGAMIGISASGVFTKTLDTPSAYLQYFKAVDESKDVKATGNALEIAAGAEEIAKYNAIHTQAEQMTADGVFAAGGTVTATCPVCEKEVQWLDLNALENKKITEAAHYYLSDDLQTSALYNMSADVCLHLNGHSITSSARALYVEAGCHANIMGEGTVSGVAQEHSTLGWWGTLDISGSADLFGGTYTCTNDGPAVTGKANSAAGVINMYEGASVVRTDSAGIGVRLYDDADFNMYGGNVSGAANNFLLESSTKTSRTVTLNIYAGTVENGAAGQGGNVYASGASASVNIYGGSVTDGDIYLAADAKGILLSGAPVVSELDLTSGIQATLFNLTEDAQIGVVATGAFTVANENAEAYLNAGYIKPALDKTTIYEENDILVMEREKTYCAHCEQKVVWDEWPGINSPVSGHYYISGDYTAQTKQLSIAADTDVVLDLQGHTYSTTGIRNFLVRGTLSIVDTVGGGEMVTTGNAETHGGIALVSTASGSENAATFNLYSGILRLADEHAVCSNGGLLQISSKAVMNMYGGVITGGEASAAGGNVSIGAASATFNMYGGEILNGNAPTGDGVNVAGTFNMEGGSVDGEVAIAADATAVTLSNAVQIGKLNIAEGKLIDVSGLTTGAQIGVKAQGIFTKTLTDAESYLGCFTKLQPEDEYQVVDNAIALISISEEDRLNAIHTKAEQMTADNVFASGGTVTAVCPVCGTEEQWTELNKTTNIKKIETAGHYYLSESVNNSTYYGFYADACLHLNGKNITSSARAIYVDATSTTLATLNIMGEGTVSGAGGDHASIPRGTVDIGGSVNFFGGTYMATGNNPAVTNRGYMGRSVVNIYDGAEFNAPNVSLLVRSNAVNFCGGTVTAGSVKVDGASNCEMNISGGTVANANEGQAAIVAAGAKGTLSITGGIVGEVTVASDLKTLSVSGAPLIANLDVSSGKKLTLGELETGAKVYVTADGTITDTLTNAAGYLSYIKAFDKDYEIVAENDVLTVRMSQTGKLNNVHTAAQKMTADGIFSTGGTVTAVCPVCGTEEQWVDLAEIAGGTKLTEDAHYYLSRSIEVSTHYNFTSNACLHLNGKNITSAARAIYVEATKSGTVYTIYSLNIMGEGTVSGAGVDHASIPRGTMDLGGSVNFFGGTYVSTGSNPCITARGFNGRSIVNIYEGTEIRGSETSNGDLIRVRSNAVNIYGGLITGGKAANGGNIYVDGGASCSLNIYGGTIKNGTADLGANIYAAGSKATVNIEGGTVSGGDVYVAANVGAITVAGDPVISELDLSSGKKLTLGELEDGADITVTAPNGAFTDASTAAASYVEFFKAAAQGKIVKAESNTLVIADA